MQHNDDTGGSSESANLMFEHDSSTSSITQQEESTDSDGLTPPKLSPRYGHNTLSKATTIATDIIAVSVSLGHVVFICLVASYDKRDVNSEYTVFKNISTTLGPLFPTIFAFVMGRFFYNAARLRLERGASLGTLEQLMGSQTIGAAVVTQLKLIAINPLSFIIIFLWVFSPLGGQSILRFLDSVPHHNTTNYQYMNVQRDDGGVAQEYIDSNPFFTDSFWIELFCPGEPVDQLANIKIPFLEPEAIDVGEHWYWFNDTQERSYSALIGIPVLDLLVGNSTFSLETSYVDFECGDLDLRVLGENEAHSAAFPTVEAVNTTALDFLDISKTLNPKYPRMPNGSWYGRPWVNDSDIRPLEAYFEVNLALDRFIDPLWLERGDDFIRYKSDKSIHSLGLFRNETTIEAGQTNLLFEYRQKQSVATKAGLISNAFLLTTRCLVLQKYVESLASCSLGLHQSRPDCTVKAQRPSQQRHLPENLSLLSNPFVFKLFLNQFPNGTLEPQSFVFMAHLDDAIKTRYVVSMSGPDEVVTIPAKNFSRALSRVFNTYSLANQAASYMTWSQSNSTMIQGSLADLSSTTNVTVQGLSHIYSISWPWFGVSLASCLVLSLASIAGVWLVHLGKGPEILGYVSTIVQNSDITGLPEHASQMNGDQLAKAIKQRRFRYGHMGSKNGGNSIGMGPEEEVDRF